MKKIIQICSLLSLIVVFTMAASATTAKADFGSEVAIPFGFNIANNTYEAGSYIVRLTKVATGAATLSIVNSKTGEGQTVILSSKGDRGGAEIKLVFETAGGKKYLTGVQTPNDTFAIVGAKSGNRNVAESKGEAARSGEEGTF